MLGGVCGELSVWEMICVLCRIWCGQPVAAGWVPGSGVGHPIKKKLFGTN